MPRYFLAARAVLFYAVYVPLTIFMSVLFMLLFPVLPPRSRYLFTSLWAKLVLQWLRLSCGVHWNVKGVENLPATPIVILANHQSSWETLFLYQLFYPVAPILKQELLKIPFFGWALRLLHPIAIDRSNPRVAGKSLLTQGTQRIQDGYSVIVFPEGTRSAPESLGRFSKSGTKMALLAGVPILPVAVRTGHCWPPRRFLKYSGVVEIEIGEAMQADGRDANAWTAAIENWMRNRLEKDQGSSD